MTVPWSVVQMGESEEGEGEADDFDPLLHQTRTE